MRCRQQIPANVRHVATKVTAIAGEAGRPRVTLATGDEIEARLAILANGLNPGLREALEIKRETLSPCHSISIGFDMKPLKVISLSRFRRSRFFRSGPTSPWPISRCSRCRAACGPISSSIGAWMTARLRTFRHQPKEALLDLIPATYTVYRALHH